MMKKVVSAVLLALLCSIQAVAQGGDRGESVLALGNGKVAVEYGRPALQGRDIMALLPVGQEWRMGSNAATTLTTDVGLRFGEKVVPAGTYVLKAKRVDPEKWNLLVMTRDNTVVAEAPLTYRKVDASQEVFTINLANKDQGGELVMMWGPHVLSTPFRAS